MSVAGKVKDFIESRPFLKEFEQMFPVVNMDLLDEKTTSYSIESTPAEPIIKRYTNGDSVRQYVFSLCSRELYGEQENGDTAEFYEKFADWLDKCTANGNLPELSGQPQSRSIRQQQAAIFTTIRAQSASTGYSVNLFISNGGRKI